MVMGAFAWLFAGRLGFNTDFVLPALPTAFMKSISGGGSRAMMIEAMKTYGPDSFVGRLVSIVGGSSDTTYNINALYFGSVGITRTRYAITYGLLGGPRGGGCRDPRRLPLLPLERTAPKTCGFGSAT